MVWGLNLAPTVFSESGMRSAEMTSKSSLPDASFFRAETMRMKGIDMRNDLTKILGNVTQHVLIKRDVWKLKNKQVSHNSECFDTKLSVEKKS